MRIGVNATCFTHKKTGVGRYVFELCKRLVNHNHQVFCYLPHLRHPSYSHEFGIIFKENKHITPINKLYWERIRLPKFLMEDQIDVFWAPAHRFLPSKFNIPSVLSIHDLIWRKAPNTMQFKTRFSEKLFTKKSIQSADAIAVVSQSTANDLKEFCGDQCKIPVIAYPGITNFPPTNEKHNLKKFGISTPFILCVGTIEPRKNHKKLLDAYQQLSPPLRNEAHLVFVGNKGWGGIDLKREIKARGLEHYAHHLTEVNDHLLATLYEHCLFLALPSLYEGFGMPLIEAMSFGKAVLTSNISSMPEVSQSAGLLVNPTNVTSITNGLEQLISNVKLRNKLEKHAKLEASKYNWNYTTQIMSDVFYNVTQIRKMKNI